MLRDDDPAEVVEAWNAWIEAYEGRADRAAWVQLRAGLEILRIFYEKGRPSDLTALRSLLTDLSYVLDDRLRRPDRPGGGGTVKL